MLITIGSNIKMCGVEEGNLQYKVWLSSKRESLCEWLWNLDSTNGRLPLGWWLNLIRMFISQCAASYAHWQSAVKTATMHTLKLIQVVHVQWKYSCCRSYKYLWKVLSTVTFYSGKNIYKISTLIKWSHQPMSILQLVPSRSQTLPKKKKTLFSKTTD